MKASVLYRIASVLILLFALGHTFGFRQIDPRWRIDSLISSLRTTPFQTQGFQRTYWDFYVGFGLFVSAFLLFAAVLAWHLGSLSASSLAYMRIPSWGLAACFFLVVLLSVRYFFVLPIVFSGVITLLLTLAAWHAKATTPNP